MFLEKFSRFFRLYDLSFGPRHKDAAYIPLNHDDENYSIRDALRLRIDDETALEVQANGDIVELMEAEYFEKEKALVLLFHRASPNAAEPAYRRKARLKAEKEAGKATGKRVTIRTATKDADEEQSVSAHLVIGSEPIGKGVYRAVLEEIPGISMAVVRQIIAKALFDYTYTFKRRGKDIETYSVVKAQGLKSETMEGALKSGHIDFITLVRPAKPKFVDAQGIFEPTNEIMRLRVRQEITGQNFGDSISALFRRAQAEGWTQFNIEIEFKDKRRRTVKLEKDQEAKEILFVRSEEAAFEKQLSACADEIVKEVVTKAVGISKGK